MSVFCHLPRTLHFLLVSHCSVSSMSAVAGALSVVTCILHQLTLVALFWGLLSWSIYMDSVRHGQIVTNARPLILSIVSRPQDHCTCFLEGKGFCLTSPRNQNSHHQHIPLITSIKGLKFKYCFGLCDLISVFCEKNSDYLIKELVLLSAFLSRGDVT